MSQTYYGRLAEQYCGLKLPLQVLKSGSGYYIGTCNDCGPVSRESSRYYPSFESAKADLDSNSFDQRHEP